MERIVQGTYIDKFQVVHLPGALDSLEDCLKGLDKQHVRTRQEGMITQFLRYCRGHQMSKDNFPSEGRLAPTIIMKAFKKKPLRAYGWLDEEANIVYITHYINKRHDKLDKADSRKIESMWKEHNQSKNQAQEEK